MPRFVVVTALGFLVVVGVVALAPSNSMTAPVAAATQASAARRATNLRGGPHGVAKTVIKQSAFRRDRRVVAAATAEQPVEGIMVQLISHTTAIRTTAYTNEFGKYEFPPLESGEYTLRLARPLEFRQHRSDPVHIDGATALPDIMLEHVSESEYLPPTPDILPQLSGAQWVANLSGTAQEKKSFVNVCGGSCHSFQYQMRARYDEPSWRKIVHRMKCGGRTMGSPDCEEPTNPFTTDELSGLPLAPGEMERVVKWLVRVRGLDAQDPPLKVFRPYGPATRAIVTEYELPWAMANIHDVAGDPEGNIWFAINRNPFVGKLDPKTGKVTSYEIPAATSSRANGNRARAGGVGENPGFHAIQVDKAGVVWFTDTWGSRQGRLDPRTGQIKLVHTGQHGNVGLSPDGSLWHLQQDVINKYDPSSADFWETGKPIKQYPMHRTEFAYGNFLSWDGRYFGGGAVGGIVWLDTQTGEVREVPNPSGDAHGRGSFDPGGNIWVGGKRGMLIKYDHRTNLVSEYWPPTPYVSFYTATADKNGEIWAGELHGGQIARFNPRTQHWIEYVLPTALSQDYQSWIDNSTDPVSYWYGDQFGYIVHVQPLE